MICLLHICSILLILLVAKGFLPSLRKCLAVTRSVPFHLHSTKSKDLLQEIVQHFYGGVNPVYCWDALYKKLEIKLPGGQNYSMEPMVYPTTASARKVEEQRIASIYIEVRPDIFFYDVSLLYFVTYVLKFRSILGPSLHFATK